MTESERQSEERALECRILEKIWARSSGNNSVLSALPVVQTVLCKFVVAKPEGEGFDLVFSGDCIVYLHRRLLDTGCIDSVQTQSTC